MEGVLLVQKRGPAHALILDFWPPEVRDNAFLSLQLARAALADRGGEGEKMPRAAQCQCRGVRDKAAELRLWPLSPLRKNTGSDGIVSPVYLSGFGPAT